MLPRPSITLLLIAVSLISAKALATEVLFDRSPANTGAAFNGVWASDANGQEQYDQVPSLGLGLLEGISYYTYNSTRPPPGYQPQFQVVGRANEAGKPAAILLSVKSKILSIEPAAAINRSDLVAVHLTFAGVAVPASSFWITIAGGATQYSPYLGTLTGAPGEDGTFQAFSANGHYSISNPAGDIAFKLYGISAVPEISTLLLLLSGLLMISPILETRSRTTPR